MLYQIGQFVYTARTIRGWFDYSMEDHIPANTVGIVEHSAQHYSPETGKIETLYAVQFPTFGQVSIREADLKLG